MLIIFNFNLESSAFEVFNSRNFQPSALEVFSSPAPQSLCSSLLLLSSSLSSLDIPNCCNLTAPSPPSRPEKYTYHSDSLIVFALLWSSSSLSHQYWSQALQVIESLQVEILAMPWLIWKRRAPTSRHASRAEDDDDMGRILHQPEARDELVRR